MKGLKITMIKSASVALTAEDWNLYRMKGVEHFVHDLNLTIEKAYTRGAEKREAYQQAYLLMQVNSEYGALDSEPLGMLDQVLDRLYQ